MTHIASFDYSILDTEVRSFIEQRTGEIRALVRRSAEDIIEIGLKLQEVKERLPHGSFGPWLEEEFGWSWQTANNFMNVASKFQNFGNLENFAASALYALAAPSTPPEAREEALALARNGTAVSQKAARKIINGHNEEMDDREPVPFPDPVPEERVVEAGRDLYQTVETSHSAHLISDGRIKRPFEIEGKLYVNQGGGWSSDTGKYAVAELVVPIADWPGRPYTKEEIRERKAYGPCYYFGAKVTQGSNEYVLDPRDRIRFILKAQEEPKEPQEQYTPVFQLENWVRNWIRDVAGDDRQWQMKLLMDIKNNVSGAFTRLTLSRHIDGLYRKHELKQAVNNVLEQMRQRDEWPAEVPDARVEVSEHTSNEAAANVHFSSARHDWETPQDLFDELNAEFAFDVDVCANEQNYKCPYYDEEDDALELDWGEQTCWMNPPYGRAIAEWVAKAYMSSLRGATVVCLLPARTDTRWWWDYVIHGEVRFLKGRLRFVGAENSAPFPSAVVVFRPGVPEDAAKVLWWEREGGELDDA